MTELAATLCAPGDTGALATGIAVTLALIVGLAWGFLVGVGFRREPHA